MESFTSDHSRTILIAATNDIGNEYECIRQCLEYFGCKTMLFFIGRPNDFFKIFNADISNLATIICAHGKEGNFIVPELAEEVYLENECREFITPTDLKGNLDNKINTPLIWSTACTTGNTDWAQTFRHFGVQHFLAPNGYEDGNEVLFSTLNFFFNLLVKNRSIAESFQSLGNQKIIHYY